MQLSIFKHLKALAKERKYVCGPISYISEDVSEMRHGGTATVYEIFATFGSRSAVMEGKAHGQLLEQAIDVTRKALTREIFGPIEDELLRLALCLQRDDREEAMRRCDRIDRLIHGEEIADE